MGVRITDLETVALYDSVSGFAFGPTFPRFEEAAEFLEWAEREGIDDVRTLSDSDLEHHVSRFRDWLDNDPDLFDPQADVEAIERTLDISTVE